VEVEEEDVPAAAMSGRKKADLGPALSAQIRAANHTLFFFIRK
jgi:hypothetical protein